MAVPLIIDTDIGTDVDDAVALAFAARHPGIDLRAVTTCNGRARLRAEIARVILDAAGLPDVPVGAGREVGLSGIPHPGMPAGIKPHNHGLELSHAVTFPDAGQVLSDALEVSPEPVVICTIGAVTNVAALLSERPELWPKVRELHVMGGCFGPVSWGDPAGTEAPWFFETNLGCDPLASCVLFSLPLPLTVVPVDVTMPLMFNSRDRDRIGHGGAFGELLAGIMDKWVQVGLANIGRHLPPGSDPAHFAAVRLHDPLTVAGLVEPGVYSLEEVKVSVAGTAGRVRTQVSSFGRPARVCRSANEDRLRKLLTDTISSQAS